MLLQAFSCVLGFNISSTARNGYCFTSLLALRLLLLVVGVVQGVALQEFIYRIFFFRVK
uniref:Uncharacterized protein n=1 Tax=Manihot esculenta TaxID=3983 RepID=A0A2C9VHD4_MANES